MRISFLRHLWERFAAAIVRAAWKHEQRRTLRACKSVGEGGLLRMPLVVRSPECLTLGRNVHLGEYVHIRAGGGVTIGDNVAVAAHVVIASQGHPVELPRCHGLHWSITEAPVVIEDDVWIGSGAIVLPGTRVGRGAVVAAGAVVSRDVPAMSVVAGVPAKPIGEVRDGKATGEQAGWAARLAS